MKPLYHATPLLPSHPLSRLTGKKILLKCESLQSSGSFKDRGIGTLCQHYANQGVKGFISSSGGNAGMAVAFAAQVLQLPATIVVPESTPELIIHKLRQEQANVIVFGESWEEADKEAKRRVEQEHLAYIPPFDHPLIWEGYTSIITECVESGIQPDAILLSVGGGGLYSGIVQGCHRVGWENVSIITAETQGADSFAQSMQQQKRVHLDKIDTIAKTLGAKQICQQAFDWSQKHPTLAQVVSDKAAVNACLRFADDHRLLVEPACGAALSILYDSLPVLSSFQTIIIIICGGSTVSLDLLQSWKAIV